MKRKKLWITLSLFNLSIVALLGIILRTKFLFPLPFIDYRNMLSAHSHFAFGGWVTLILMVLLIDNLLSDVQKQKNSYQFILWGIEITATGMLLSFPFQGYGSFSIPFSSLFIFFTYLFTWVFIRDLGKSGKTKPVIWLAISAGVCLVISSVGPFALGYMMATKTGNAFRFRDAVYTFMHFQYNGFFTLSIFALYFDHLNSALSISDRKRVSRFSLFLIFTIIPALFLTMLWHGYNKFIFSLALFGCILICTTLFFFFDLVMKLKKKLLFNKPLARTLILFSLIAFAIKMILQMGTIYPALGNAVFGFRPIIIGFLHLVFLGFVSFYCLSYLIQTRELNIEKKFTWVAVAFFFGAVIFNEGVLLVDGIGLMFYVTYPVYPWLLWIASILLFTGATLVLISRLKTIKEQGPDLNT
jgi:hypothetical protein